MNSTGLPRLAGLAAVTGVVMQLFATLLEPDWGGDDAAETARLVAGNTLWDVDRLADIVGMLLTIAALTVVGRQLAAAGSEEARLGQPFLVLVGALGCAAVATGAAMKDMAKGAVEGSAEATGYLASFDALRRVTEDLFFAAFLSLGIYLAVLAAAILTTAVFRWWIGWCAGVAAVLLVGGDLVMVWVDPAYFLVLTGFALWMVTVLALGFSLVRHPVRGPSAGDDVVVERRVRAS